MKKQLSYHFIFLIKEQQKKINLLKKAFEDETSSAFSYSLLPESDSGF